MRSLLPILALAAVLASAGPANAALFHFEGSIDNHNDVVFINFSIDTDATNVRIWTDSFQSGDNFDPITALWKANGDLISQNDDNDSIEPGQTYWDSGIELASLAAGSYIFSVAAYDNFANGSTLAQGFRFDGDTPIPIENWWAQGEGYWSLWLDGVDQASNPDVPEPTSIILWSGLGVMGLVTARRRRRAA